MNTVVEDETDLWESVQRVAYFTVNGEEIPVESVEILDIEEDFSGRDLYTFLYEGKEVQSFAKHKYI